MREGSKWNQTRREKRRQGEMDTSPRNTWLLNALPHEWVSVGMHARWPETWAWIRKRDTLVTGLERVLGHAVGCWVMYVITWHRTAWQYMVIYSIAWHAPSLQDSRLGMMRLHVTLFITYRAAHIKKTPWKLHSEIRVHVRTDYNVPCCDPLGKDLRSFYRTHAKPGQIVLSFFVHSWWE